MGGKRATSKVRWQVGALLPMVVGAILAFGPAVQAGAAARMPVSPAKAARVAGVAIRAPVGPSSAVHANAGNAYLMAADEYSVAGGLAVGDTQLASSRPTSGEFDSGGYTPAAAADVAVARGAAAGFSDVSALSANDAFGVGWIQTDTTGALIERFDGSAWSAAEAPDVPGWELLLGVDARTANDVWAVGVSQGGTLIEHFDGSAWSVVPAPAVPGSLDAVAAIAADNVYAVGYYFSGARILTLAMHYDGTGWSVVPTPNRGYTRNMLADLVVNSPNDIWAVGYSNGNGGRHKDRTLIEHFNGTTWSIVPSPNVGDGSNELWAIDAVAANDLWAVGEFRRGTLILHFDGTSWTADTQTPTFSAQGDSLNAVVVLGPDDVWAFGGWVENQFGSDPQYRSLIHHFDGTSWQNI